MFIRGVDQALEKLLRERLPLPEDIGDISFEAPTGTWSAQLSRLTVNLFLYHLERSAQPARAATVRVVGESRPEQRAPQPMVALSYLVSAWAGSPRDEHQLLGDVTSLLGRYSAIPPEFVPDHVSSSVLLKFGGEDGVRPRDIWSGVNGQLKASYLMQATVAADSWDWEDQAPPVSRVESLLAPIPRSQQTPGGRFERPAGR